MNKFPDNHNGLILKSFVKRIVDNWVYHMIEVKHVHKVMGHIDDLVLDKIERQE